MPKDVGYGYSADHNKMKAGKGEMGKTSNKARESYGHKDAYTEKLPEDNMKRY